MQIMKKQNVLLLVSSFALASCGEVINIGSLSNSSSKEPLTAEEAFSAFSACGKAYYSQDNIGQKNKDNTGSTYSFDGISVDSSTKDETEVSASFKDVAYVKKENNIGDLDATDYTMSLEFSQGSGDLNFQDTGYSIKNLKPNFYISDYTFYSDLSQNKTLILALNMAVKTIFGTADYYPSWGKAYRNIAEADLDATMPIGKNLKESFATTVDHLKTAYDSHPDSFNFDLTDGIYTIEANLTDKTSIGEMLKDEVAQISQLTSTQKTKIGEKIDDYVAALKDSTRSFGMKYTFSSSLLLERKDNIELYFDIDSLKESEPDATAYLTSVVDVSETVYLDNEEAALSLPSDVNKTNYQELADLDWKSLIN